jgi:hypothetical protein
VRAKEGGGGRGKKKSKELFVLSEFLFRRVNRRRQWQCYNKLYLIEKMNALALYLIWKCTCLS